MGRPSMSSMRDDDFEWQGRPSLARIAATTPPRSLSELCVYLNQAAEGPHALPCLNPMCDQSCEWPSRGRPKLFCSQRCKDRVVNERRRLIQEVELLEDFLATTEGDSVNHRRVRKELGRRRWELARYPDRGAHD